eukprot:596076-Pelagomonas_calceolata.AAC.3
MSTLNSEHEDRAQISYVIPFMQGEFWPYMPSCKDTCTPLQSGSNCLRVPSMPYNFEFRVSINKISAMNDEDSGRRVKRGQIVTGALGRPATWCRQQLLGDYKSSFQCRTECESSCARLADSFMLKFGSRHRRQRMRAAAHGQGRGVHNTPQGAHSQVIARRPATSQQAGGMWVRDIKLRFWKWARSGGMRDQGIAYKHRRSMHFGKLDSAQGKMLGAGQIHKCMPHVYFGEENMKCMARIKGGGQPGSYRTVSEMYTKQNARGRGRMSLRTSNQAVLSPNG